MNAPAPVSKPSIMGEAPKLALIVLPVFAAALLLTLLLPGRFRFAGRYWGVGMAVGIELAAAGLLFWASAAFQFVRAWRGGRLATRGAYGLCRHPIHGWWIWSVLPSLALMLDSWLLLVAALFFWIAARRLQEREEQDLAERFGREYCAYEVQRRATLPVPLLRPIRFRRYLKAACGLALLGVFALGVYFAAVRLVIPRLGATRAELSAAMPGDESVRKPRFTHTQAVTIRAPAEEVWRWLVQVGYRRAGWYNVDAINRLAAPDYFIDGRGSSTRIHPELQDLAVGDTIFLVPVLGMSVTALERARLLVLVGDPAHPEAASNSSWSYLIEPRGEASCRLVVRFRAAYPGDFVSVLAWGIINEVGSAMLQQPAMLDGLRRRAEWKLGQRTRSVSSFSTKGAGFTSPGFPPILISETLSKERTMREKTPRSMLKWISRTYDLPPSALAFMFKRDRRTIDAWLREGRISAKNGTKIRSSFYYLNNMRDPLDRRASAIDMC